MTILHIDSSTQGNASVTRELTGYLVSQMNGEKIDRLDLVTDSIPHLIGRPAANAYVERLKAAHTIVIGAPTYNFTIPTQLKAWVDRIAVAGETFRYTANGPEGLLSDKRVIVIIASGGVYEEGHSFEHNKSYLRALFQFLGLEAEFVVANGVATSEEARAEAIAEAKTKIDKWVARHEFA